MNEMIIPSTEAPGKGLLSASRTRTVSSYYFFVVMALFFIAVAVTGFFPSYQAMSSGILLPHWVVHVHGALMSGWLLAFLLQTIFAASGRFKYHRQFGIFSGVLGVTVWLWMWVVSAHATIAYHPPKEDFLFDLILMEFYAIISFGTLFTRGYLSRKTDLASHKRFLMLATMVVLQAAVDRIHWLPSMLGLGYPYLYFVYLDMMLLPLFVYDLITLRRIHKASLFGAVLIICLQLSVSAVWQSHRWHDFWFAAASPFMEKRVEIRLTDAQAELLVGDYGDPNYKSHISHEGDKMFISVPDPQKIELGATSPTEFFAKTMSVTLSFITGPDGKVTKMIVHQGAAKYENMKLK